MESESPEQEPTPVSYTHLVVRDSIIMRHSTIGEGTQVNKAIIAENVHVGKHVVMGVGEEAPNVYHLS